METQIALPETEIVAFCRRHRIQKLSLFGSVLRADFGPDSDVDVLVTFSPGQQPALADLLKMEDELRAIFGRNVDLGERLSVEEDPNYIRRQHILGAEQVIYAE